MDKGLKALYKGDFNSMSQEHLADGSIIIELSKEGSHEYYRFHVKDLYSENETVLSHEIIEIDPKPHVKARMAEANKPDGEELWK